MIVTIYLKVNNIWSIIAIYGTFIAILFSNNQIIWKRRNIMRVTSSMYYKSLYGTNNLKINNELFDVNKQIASGLKIQYAKDDVRTFTETMRLDNELTTIGQVKKSTQSGYKVSNQTDDVLNEFETSMNRMRTLLVNAANGTNSNDSLDAIAGELRGLEKHFKNLANTSINGQYLFSGSAVNTKPIDFNGIYHGNDAGMNSVLGSNSTQKYNLTGAELFLGEEQNTKREITTNVKQSLNAPSSSSSTLSTSSTMREFMGDANSPNNHYFYVRGTQSDGTAFNQKILMTDTETVGDLLTKIGKGFGNTGDTKIVDVSLNGNGEIVIKDKKHGSSKLDFHMVGATDFSGGTAADVSNIENLDSGTTNYATASSGTGSLYIKEFVKSGFDSAKTNTGTNIAIHDALLYDRTMFNVSGNTVSSNIPQIDKTTNAFATNSTKLLDVASGTTLDGKQLEFRGTDTSGNAFTVQIDLKNSGSTFSLDGGVTNYDIFNTGSSRQAVDSDKMTYRQLMDVVNMAVTNKLPATTNNADDYDDAIKASNTQGNTSLTYDGKLKFTDLTATQTQATVSLYDVNSGNFTKPSSVLSFNANNALTIVDPKTDFFKNLDDVITAVEDHKLYPDSSSGNMRNQGIENAIAMLDKLQSHVSRNHAVVGAQSNALNNSLERTSLLETSTITLRSEVIDTDIAEASLKLQQLNLNYQAMLSTVGKVSKLSLVNYL